MRIFSLLLVAALAACGSSPSSHTTGAGGASGAGGAVSTGGAAGAGGTSPALGGSMGTGSNTGTGGRTGGDLGGAGGVAATGGTIRSDAGPGAGGRTEAAAGESGGGRGGAGAGGATGNGGMRSDAGPGGRPDASGDSARDNGSTGGSAGATGDGAPCPHSGHVTYALTQKSSPSSTEQQAYTLITKAMDEAVHYYNCYTDITKQLKVSYDTSVSTADGNVNGSIRFGSGTQYMVSYTAMHEIAHTVGVGQNASSNWLSFIDIPSGGSSGPWKGTNALAELRAITGDAAATLTADHDHFWPYGLNKSSDPHADPDLVAHCRMVVALRTDLGLQ